ncbi:MAG: hypothetical protein HC897_13480 [Thermoanaerobaculia bacterium]|nr:hypothetical protein [Thermoanaerobaculia bacterium]
MRSFVPDQERDLVLGLVIGRIGEDEFLASFPRSPRTGAAEWLERATRERDPLGVDLALSLGHRFGFVERSLPHLLALTTAEWHQRHEDVVDALAILRAPQAVAPVFEVARMSFPYRDYDEFSTLGVKCVWALRRIGTLEAVARLGDLSRCDDPILAEAALGALHGLTAESDSQEVRDAARNEAP